MWANDPFALSLCSDEGQRSKCKHWNLPGTKFVGTVFKLRKTMKNSQSCAHVLRNALNFVISRCRFAEDSKENVPKNYSVCAEQLSYLSFSGVLATVAVVVCFSLAFFFFHSPS